MKVEYSYDELSEPRYSIWLRVLSQRSSPTMDFQGEWLSFDNFKSWIIDNGMDDSDDADVLYRIYRGYTKAEHEAQKILDYANREADREANRELKRELNAIKAETRNVKRELKREANRAAYAITVEAKRVAQESLDSEVIERVKEWLVLGINRRFKMHAVGTVRKALLNSVLYRYIGIHWDKITHSPSDVEYRVKELTDEEEA